MSSIPPQPEKDRSASSAGSDGKAHKEQSGRKSSLPPAGDVHFHYNREERLAMPSAPRRKSEANAKRASFKKNILLVILLIAILVISIILLLYKGVIHLPSNSSAVSYRQELGGYSFMLQGLQLKDKLSASLTIKKMKEQAEVTGLLYVRFSGEKEMILSSMDLPADKNEEKELTTTLFETPGDKLLKAEITLGKDIFILSRKINNE